MLFNLHGCEKEGSCGRAAGMAPSQHAEKLGKSFGTRDKPQCSIQPLSDEHDAGLQEDDLASLSIIALTCNSALQEKPATSFQVPPPLFFCTLASFSSAFSDLPALAPLRNLSPSSFTTASTILLLAQLPHGCSSNLLFSQTLGKIQLLAWLCFAPGSAEPLHLP